MPVALQLFGAPTIELGDGTPPIALPFERRSQLIVLLALRRAWVGRAELAALLWPDQADKLAFTNMRKTLFRLQGLAWGASLETQGPSLRVQAHTDVHDFEQALADQRRGDALVLYRGPLLAGFDDDANEAWTGWLRFERERVRAAWRAAALDSLAADPEPAAALALAARLLEADPLDEAALQAQVSAYATSGQLARARQAWSDFAQRLRSELGIEPGAELQALWDALDEEHARSRPMPLLPPLRAAVPADEGFVGRSAELRRVAGLFATGGVRLVTLAGPGGIGKTRLAQRALQDLTTAFADGTHFVALEDTEEAEVMLARIAQATGITLRGGAPTLDQLGAALRDRHMLLALDNFEQIADAGATVLEPLLAAAPRLALLVTSRMRLGLTAEQLLPLEGLPCTEREDADRIEAFDAARVFVAAARRVAPALQPAAEAEAIVDICRQLDGLPLALELAAAWTRVLSCAEIAAELREGTALLRDDSGARAPRHASIAQVFAQSWQRLAPVEREALAVLSVFQGGFSAEAARAVAGTPLPVLGALIDKSLLHKDGQHLALHPLVQQLAAARLEPALLMQARRAHAAWFHRVLAQLAPAVKAGERAALQSIDDQLENGRQAWRRAVVDGDAAAVRSTGGVLHQYLDNRGRYGEGLTLMRQAIDAPPLRADATLQAWLLACAAHFEYRLDRYAAAQTLATRALAVESADLGTQERAHGVIGTSALRQGRHAEALARFERVFALAEEGGDGVAAAGALDHQALAQKYLGRYDTALALTHDALTRYRALGQVVGEAICVSNLGGLHLARDDAAAAEPYLLEAVALCEREGLTGPLQFALGNLCDIDVLFGRLDAAQAHAEQLIALARASGQRAVALNGAAQLARVAVRRGDLATARAALAETAQAAIALGTPIAWGNALLVLAELLQAQGESAAADRVLGFAAEHPVMSTGLRDQFIAERRRAGFAEHCALGWPGLEFDELLQRIVAEAPLEHAPLIALLRA
jgi:predicted ATPase/DNA-binding SARP family transcriptional activator